MTPEQLNEALLKAAKGNKAEKVLNLIKQGADANCVDKDGNTPLMLVAGNNKESSLEKIFKSKDAENSPSTISILLANGAEINARNTHGDTALMIATKNLDAKTVAILLKNKAQINVPNINGNTPISCIAGHNTNDESFKVFLTFFKKEFNEENKETFLQDRAEIKSNLNHRNKAGDTPLMLATKNGDKKMILALLALGADINIADNDGKTPLMYAAVNNNSEKMHAVLVTLLEKGAQIHNADYFGNTALILSTTDWHEKSVKILLDHGARSDDVNFGGQTALILASKRYALPAEIFQKYVSAARFGLDHADIAGNTAFFYAARHGALSSMKILLKEGANFNHKNHSGETGYSILKSTSNHKDARKIILEHRGKVREMQRIFQKEILIDEIKTMLREEFPELNPEKMQKELQQKFPHLNSEAIKNMVDENFPSLDSPKLHKMVENIVKLLQGNAEKTQEIVLREVAHTFDTQDKSRIHQKIKKDFPNLNSKKIYDEFEKENFDRKIKGIVKKGFPEMTPIEAQEMQKEIAAILQKKGSEQRTPNAILQNDDGSEEEVKGEIIPAISQKKIIVDEVRVIFNEIFPIGTPPAYIKSEAEKVAKRIEERLVKEYLEKLREVKQILQKTFPNLAEEEIQAMLKKDLTDMDQARLTQKSDQLALDTVLDVLPPVVFHVKPLVGEYLGYTDANNKLVQATKSNYGITLSVRDQTLNDITKPLKTGNRTKGNETKEIVDFTFEDFDYQMALAASEEVNLVSYASSSSSVSSSSNLGSSSSNNQFTYSEEKKEVSPNFMPDGDAEFAAALQKEEFEGELSERPVIYDTERKRNELGFSSGSVTSSQTSSSSLRLPPPPPPITEQEEKERVTVDSDTSNTPSNSTKSREVPASLIDPKGKDQINIS